MMPFVVAGRIGLLVYTARAVNEGECWGMHVRCEDTVRWLGGVRNGKASLTGSETIPVLIERGVSSAMGVFVCGMSAVLGDTPKGSIAGWRGTEAMGALGGRASFLSWPVPAEHATLNHWLLPWMAETI